MVNSQKKKVKDVNPRLRRKLDNFLDSLSDVLIDITALEVNTMVVEQITGNKFIAWEAYRDIYLISPQYIENRKIHPSLQARYLNIRKKLEMEYCLYFIENQASEMEASELREYYQILGDTAVQIDPQSTKLPSPLSASANPAAEIEKIQILLDDGRFLRSLRKINELKAALDNRNRALKKSEAANSEDAEEDVTTDIIYAQTVMQLDGDIINRYHERILDHAHKDIILDIHREGVISGEKQWHGLLEFMVNLVESLASRVASINGSNNHN